MQNSKTICLFDFDGTLIKGDLTKLAFKRLYPSKFSFVKGYCLTHLVGVLFLAFSSERNILASDLAMFKHSSFLTNDDLFHTGDIQSLKKAIKRKLSSTNHVQERDLAAYRITFKELVSQVYNNVL